MLTEISVNLAHLRERVSRNPALKLSRINLFCGPNGTGKSTVLNGFREFVQPESARTRNWTQETAPVLVNGECKAVCFFDTEADNLRHARLDGVFDPHALNAYFDAKEMSHGQSNYRALSSILGGSEYDVVVLDEPETAVDLDGVLWLYHEIAKSDKQFLVATHNPLLLQLATRKDSAVHVFGKDDLYHERIIHAYSDALTGKPIPKAAKRNKPLSQSRSMRRR